MPWVEKEIQLSFEKEPIEGLFCWDGAWLGTRGLTKDYKNLMILFPSNYACCVGMEPEGRVVVAVCFKVWLPYQSTRDQGWEEARRWAEFLGYPYPLIKHGADSLEMWGKREYRLEKVDPPHILVKYDNERRRMVDVMSLADTHVAEPFTFYE